MPHVWKLANISPIAKETPVFQKNQLRPISVTNVIMRIFDELVYIKRSMSVPINSHITSDQHAYRQGQSTATGLLKVVRDDVYTGFLNIKNLLEKFADDLTTESSPTSNYS